MAIMLQQSAPANTRTAAGVRQRQKCQASFSNAGLAGQRAPVAAAKVLPGMFSSATRTLLAGSRTAAVRRPYKQGTAAPGQVCAIQSPPTSTSAASPPAGPDAGLTELARLNLRRAAVSCRRYGWLAFWCQLVLSTVSTVVLLFSAAFTPGNVPTVSVYLTLFGVCAGFLSTFWAFGYTRLSRRLFAYLDSPGVDALKKVRRSEVTSTLEKGIMINTLGMGATLLGLCATVGTLMAKTLTTATSNPFVAANSGAGWNPVLALDIFNVQASTNTLLAHFISYACSLWMLKTVSDKRVPKVV